VFTGEVSQIAWRRAASGEEPQRRVLPSPDDTPSDPAGREILVNAGSAREPFADRIVSDMADVQRAAGIRQHFEHVELGPGGILLGLIEIGVFPTLVPLQFDLTMVVGLFGHSEGRNSIVARPVGL